MRKRSMKKTLIYEPSGSRDLSQEHLEENQTGPVSQDSNLHESNMRG